MRKHWIGVLLDEAIPAPEFAKAASGAAKQAFGRNLRALVFSSGADVEIDDLEPAFKESLMESELHRMTPDEHD